MIEDPMLATSLGLLVLCGVALLVAIPLSIVTLIEWLRRPPVVDLTPLPGDTPVPLDPTYFLSEKEKVDTASISVIVSNYREVPGTERRNEAMTIYIMNTKTRINAARTDKNEYFADNAYIVFIERSAGNVIAAQSHGDFNEEILFTDQALVNDTGLGHRAMGMGVIVGAIAKGKEYGDVPTKTVPFYVYK